MDAWQIIALLGCVIIIYTLIFSKKEQPVNRTQLLSEVEDTLALYVDEIEQSNRHVVDQLQQLRADRQAADNQWQARLNQLEEKVHELNHRLELLEGESVSFEKQAPSSAPAALSQHETEGFLFQERYQAIIEQKRSGLPDEEIIKSSGLNPDEVRLILQLIAREERHLE